MWLTKGLNKTTLLNAMKYLGLLIFLLSLACTGEPPVISGQEWMVVYRYDVERRAYYTELNVFARVEDQDGTEDIDNIFVYYSEEPWGWNTDKSQLVQANFEGSQWVGVNGLTLGGDFPKGRYIIQIRDRGGYTAKAPFIVTPPISTARRVPNYPSVTSQNGVIELDLKGRPIAAIWLYNNDGEFVREIYLGDGSIRVDSILNETELGYMRSFLVYIQDEVEGYGIKSGPYPVMTP